MTQPIRWLQDEIADRMLQKLDIVKLDVKDILIVPDFPGKHLHIFAKRYPGACLTSLLDESVSGFEMWRAKAMSHWRSFFGGRTSSLASYTSSGRFDVPDNSVDLVFSDLLLQDLADPKPFLQECWRVLRDGGLIAFSYLGPDTGKELRSLVIPGLRLKNLLSPWDMHDMGDALLSERFSDPVMDMEYLTLDYESDAVFLADVSALKLIHSSPIEASEMNVLPQKLTLEVVYGHAWVIGKHLAKAKDNVAYIDLNQIGRKTRPDSA
ncbi:methyltransferase domain-containing protein [Polynucleobacter sp. AP-Capit-er-40B-B4]|uniref:methyltransferase domain-containing protein n=1 Tax=Polynucleobacter sp. AP-Capit-er-40B-B4 TaxID=2576927 RepID=UPI002104027C|nr:methyltransferase domain-containing protein [Polynucleobacter sp. AP-Capit-er-40B-B4]MBU3581884.1 methyltransferase domain-containing protein [Polynucleobacter sp. AP-Capit-er-40B-B4]